MDIILWRHAEAEDGIPDERRKLTSKGKKQSEKMAEWLKTRLPKGTRFIVSPSMRTIQTAQAYTDDYKVDKMVGTGASAEDIIHAADWPHMEEAVVVVGHQPTLGEVAAKLLSNRATGGINIKKGAIWWFTRIDGETTLKAVISPGLL
jgi:phosphohistidine phosphatase